MRVVTLLTSLAPFSVLVYIEIDLQEAISPFLNEMWLGNRADCQSISKCAREIQRPDASCSSIGYLTVLDTGN